MTTMSSFKFMDMDNNTVHNNENYWVVINDEGDGYGVVNRETGVTEFEAQSLPECIFAAENLNVVLVFKTYAWVGKRAMDREAEDRKLEAKEAGLSLIN